MSRLRLSSTSSCLWLEGDLDLFSCEQLRAELERFHESREAELRIDLSRLETIDPVGVELLLGTRGRLGSERGRLLVLGARGRVFQMFATHKDARALSRF